MASEAIADIVAEMRYGAIPKHQTDHELLALYADRIEAAADCLREDEYHRGAEAREKFIYAVLGKPSNSAAMREALEYLCSISDLDLSELEVLGKRLKDTSTYGGGLVLKLVHGVRNGQKALAKPPRQCDVGTAEEQYKRFRDYCYSKRCESLITPNTLGSEVAFAWAQMPYNE